MSTPSNYILRGSTKMYDPITGKCWKCNVELRRHSAFAPASASICKRCAETIISTMKRNNWDYYRSSYVKERQLARLVGSTVDPRPQKS